MRLFDHTHQGLVHKWRNIPFDSLISPFLTYDRNTLAWGGRYFNTLHSFGC